MWKGRKNSRHSGLRSKDGKSLWGFDAFYTSTMIFVFDVMGRFDFDLYDL